MLPRLHERRWAARGWAYAILGATLLPLVLTFVAGELPSRLFVVSAVGIAAITAVMEIAIAIGGREGAKPLFAEGEAALLKQLGGLDRLMRGAREIDLLAGAGGFTTEEANLKAIRGRVESGAKIRILLMHPEGDGVKMMARARNARGMHTPDDEIPSEVRKSLTRIAHFCGERSATELVRLYWEPRTISLYRFDDRFVVSVHPGGRGSSAPAFFIGRSAHSRTFCDRLMTAFLELWDTDHNRMTRRLTPALLAEIMAVDRDTKPPPQTRRRSEPDA